MTRTRLNLFLSRSGIFFTFPILNLPGKGKKRLITEKKIIGLLIYLLNERHETSIKISSAKRFSFLNRFELYLSTSLWKEQGHDSSKKAETRVNTCHNSCTRFNLRNVKTYHITKTSKMLNYQVKGNK